MGKGTGSGEGKGGCGCLAKLIIILINIVFFLAGGGILAVGIYLKFDKELKLIRGIMNFIPDTEKIEKLMELDIIKSATLVLIIFGSVMCCIALLGCCGACTGNRICLILYIVSVSLILLVQLIVVIVAIVMMKGEGKPLKELFVKSLKATYKKDEGANSENVWDILQASAQCCGVNGGVDYSTFAYEKVEDADEFPMSCCKKDISGNDCNDGVDATKNNGARGCIPVILDGIASKQILMACVAAGIILVQILCILFACLICSGKL
ncbi:hypothetical protein SNEBB_007270 [Seison nebaliae]|nr:hypothetical protein SNEBB_007270 [Seison nebaliae]